MIRRGDVVVFVCLCLCACQGGDPSGRGSGGESLNGEELEDEIVDSLRHDSRGVVSMAKKPGTFNTAKSQFFILYAAAPHLNHIHTVFAKVIDGFETLDEMERVPVDAKDRPLTPIIINRVKIHANPFAAQAETTGK